MKVMTTKAKELIVMLMKEEEFIVMLNDLIYAEEELSDNYSKAADKAIDLLNKLKTKQLFINIIAKQ